MSSWKNAIFGRGKRALGTPDAESRETNSFWNSNAAPRTQNTPRGPDAFSRREQNEARNRRHEPDARPHAVERGRAINVKPRPLGRRRPDGRDWFCRRRARRAAVLRVRLTSLLLWLLLFLFFFSKIMARAPPSVRRRRSRATRLVRSAGARAASVAAAVEAGAVELLVPWYRTSRAACNRLLSGNRDGRHTPPHGTRCAAIMWQRRERWRRRTGQTEPDCLVAVSPPNRCAHGGLIKRGRLPRVGWDAFL